MKAWRSLFLLAGLALGLLPATSRADTFRITGMELTDDTTTAAADGSVRTEVRAGVDGVLYHVEGRTRLAAQALLTMAITVNGDELVGAELKYVQGGRMNVTVTIQIDPCWFEYVNERDATAAQFGADVVARIEAESPPGAMEPCIKMWLTERLALLGAKTAEPYIKGGITLVSPRR
jgi:hypothetical protein